MTEFDIADNDIVRNFTIVVPPETFEFDKTIYSFLHSQGDAIDPTSTGQPIGLRVPEEPISAGRIEAHRAGRTNENIERIATCASHGEWTPSGQVYVAIGLIDPRAIHILLLIGC